MKNDFTVQQPLRRIAAIVVTYNRCELLLGCISALILQTYQEFDILIIDNASTDNTYNALQEYINSSKILYYNTGSNIGGAGGFNYGIRKAYELGYDYYWLMDDDTYPTQSALEELMKADCILDGQYGFLSSYVSWIDGSICEMNVPSMINDVEPVKTNDGSRLFPIHKATFVSFLVSKRIVEKVGLPIKDFFIWCDDINYCMRICKFIYGYWVTQSVVIHKMDVNACASVVFDNSERLARYVFEYRNMFYNARYSRETMRYLLTVFMRIGRIMISSKDRKMLRIG